MDIIPFPTPETPDVGEPTSMQDVASQAASLAVPVAQPGHVFTLAWLEAAFGLPPKPAETRNFEAWSARRARLIDLWMTDMLTTHHIHIERQAGRGYLVIAPNDTPFVAVKLAVRDFSRTVRRASDKILFTPDGLTNKQRQERMDALAFIGMVEQAVKHARPKPPRPGQRKDPKQLPSPAEE